MESLSLILIEIILAASATAILLLTLFASKTEQEKLPQFTLAILGSLFLGIPFLWNLNGTLFEHVFRLDRFALFFKALFIGSGFCVIYMAKSFEAIQKRAGEFNLLVILAILGACVLVSAGNLAVIFISIELMTITLYILTAYFKSNKESIEAAAKYLVMGAFSSGIMLYGISLIYSVAGSFSLDAIQLSLDMFGHIPGVFYAGFLLFLAGVGFKISLFPFQLWVPDVYQGAPTPVTAFLSVISKSAGFAVLVRFLGVVDKTHTLWAPLLALLSAATLLYGNLGALPQINGNLKRLLGYSSIAHAGYLLMGIATHTALGLRATLYYLVVYALANLIIFLGISLSKIEKEFVSNFKGLFLASPAIAISMFIALLSLAGIPPLGGFIAKFFLLQAVVEKGMLWLAFIGAINIVISLYYYLSVVKAIYVDSGNQMSQKPIYLPVSAKLLVMLLAGSLIILGIFQVPLFALTAQALQIYPSPF